MLPQPTKPVSHDPGFDFSMVKLRPWREKIVADLAPLKFFRMGGGTSGRAMAFCLGRSGSNPGTDLGFCRFRIAVNLCVGHFLIM